MLPLNEEHVSASMVSANHLGNTAIEVSLETIATIRKRLQHDRIDVLKMDIEGAEYEVVDDLIASGELERVGQLLIEFHHRFEGISIQQTGRLVRPTA